MEALNELTRRVPAIRAQLDYLAAKMTALL